MDFSYLYTIRCIWNRNSHLKKDAISVRASVFCSDRWVGNLISIGENEGLSQLIEVYPLFSLRGFCGVCIQAHMVLVYHHLYPLPTSTKAK